MNRIRSIYWRIADISLFPLALIAALGAIENSFGYGMIGAIENSFGYGMIGAIMHNQSFAVFVTGVS